MSWKAYRSVVREELRTLWLTHRWGGLPMILSAAVAAAVCWPLMRPSRPVTAFVYTYGSGVGASLEAWNLDSVGRWHERGSDGREARLFDVTVRGAVDGCQGSLTHERSQPDYTFFVPDVGCRSKGLLLRRGDAAWSVLGSLSIASGEAPRDP